MFGEQLLAAPFVSPVDPDTRMAKTSVWLPDGDWYNMFDGELLQGDRWVNLYGSLEVVPIFAKAGAIIPMAPLSGKNGAENPAELVLNVFPGDDGAFELYEDAGDNGRYLQGEYSLLKLDQSWQATKQVIQIHPVEGELSHLPASRGVTLKLFGIQPGANIRCSVNNEILPCAVMANSDGLLVEGIMISPADHVTIEVSAGGQALAYTPDRRAGKVSAMLREFHLASRVKQAIDGDLPAILQNTNRLLRYQQELTDSQLSALQDQL